jgi:hypothetical protein
MRSFIWVAAVAGGAVGGRALSTQKVRDESWPGPGIGCPFLSPPSLSAPFLVE